MWVRVLLRLERNLMDWTWQVRDTIVNRMLTVKWAWEKMCQAVATNTTIAKLQQSSNEEH